MSEPITELAWAELAHRSGMSDEITSVRLHIDDLKQQLAAARERAERAEKKHVDALDTLGAVYQKLGLTEKNVPPKELVSDTILRHVQQLTSGLAAAKAACAEKDEALKRIRDTKCDCTNPEDYRDRVFDAASKALSNTAGQSIVEELKEVKAQRDRLAEALEHKEAPGHFVRKPN